MKIWRAPYPRFGAGPGLARVQTVAKRLGVDLRAFGVQGAVIVGSNGKGSTAAMCAALLGQHDGAVGLFTSPHLLDLNERFRIDDEDISDADMERHWGRVVHAVEAAGLADQFGAFEFLFLLAGDWFAERGCAHTVWEAGIGGRVDPVRLIEARQLALTSLDLEHTELLGDTLETIALDKAAAAPTGSRLCVGPLSVAAQAAVERDCASRGVIVDFVAPLDRADIPLAGAHQRSNAALALRLAHLISPLSADQEQAGFSATRWPGRLETLSSEPLVVIDVGHTPDGVAAALSGFAGMRGEREAVLVCGVSRDKDGAGIVARLAPHFSTIICAGAQHKGAPAARIAAHAQAGNSAAEIILAESVTDARRLALAKAKGGAVYVAGGLFLAAEFKAVHLGRDPASLVFF